MLWKFPRREFPPYERKNIPDMVRWNHAYPEQRPTQTAGCNVQLLMNSPDRLEGRCRFRLLF